MELYSTLPHSNSIFIYMTKHSNFCPELIIDDSVKATEQLMNALILNNQHNITKAVKLVAKAKVLFNRYHEEMNAVQLVDMLCIEIKQSGVSLKPYAYAAGLNRAFKPQKTFEHYTQKQNLINLEFLTDYMLKFDGKKVTYESAFFVMVEELMFRRENNNCHVADDSLIYEIIQPKCDDLRCDSRNIIAKELKKFNREYESSLWKRYKVNYVTERFVL